MSALYPFQVTNVGDSSTPACDLELYPWGPLQDGWSFSIIPSPPFAVGVGKTLDALLAVHPEMRAAAGRYTFQLKGRPGVPSNSVAVHLDILQYASVEVRAPPARACLPGETLELPFEIVNAGNGRDRFRVDGLEASLPGPDLRIKGGDNWTAPVGPGESAIKTAILSIPSGQPPASIETWLFVSSGFDGTKAGLNRTAVAVEQVFSPGLDVWPLSASVLPWERARFNVTVLNRGNGPDAIALEAACELDHPGWTVRLERESFDLPAGSSDRTVLDIIPARDALSRNDYRVRVRVRSSGPAVPEVREEALTIGVLPVRGLAVPVLEFRYPAPVAPGETVQFRFNFTNSGNVPDAFRLSVALQPEGWTVLPGPAGSVELGPGASFEARVNMRPPAEPALSRAGDHLVRLLVAGSGQESSRLLNFTVPLAPVYLWDVLPAFGAETTVNLFLGRSATFFMNVTNAGNDGDELALSFSGANAGWGRLDLSLLVLPFGESRTLRVGIELPDSARAGTVYAVDFRAQSRHRPDLAVDRELILRVVEFDPDDPGPRLELQPERTVVEASPDGTAELSFTVRCRVEAVGNVTVELVGSTPGDVHWELVSPPGRLGIGEDRTITIRTRAPPAGGADVRCRLEFRARGDGVRSGVRTVELLVKATPGKGPAVSAEGLGVAMAIFLALGGLALGWNEVFFLAFMGLLLPLYSKIRREDVLDQYTRGKIHGYIIANPGEHYNSLRLQLRLKNGTLAYHLRVLEREGYIKSARDGMFKRFYPSEAPIPRRRSEFSAMQEVVLENIRSSPGITQHDLARRMGVSGQVVNYHVRHLASARAVRLERVGRETRCHVAGGEGGTGPPR